MAGRAHLPPLQIDRKVAGGDSLEVCEESRFSIRPAERSNNLKTCHSAGNPATPKAPHSPQPPQHPSTSSQTSTIETTATSTPRNIRDAPRIQFP